MVKIFLHVSKEEQKQRFLERIDKPEKNWKFSDADIKERALFEQYLTTYDEVITATASEHSPWYALPADQKWYTRYLVSEIMVDALEHCTHEYPKLEKESRDRLLECKKSLESE